MKRKANKEKMKICLVGSSGGHLTHLYMLKPFWKDKDRFWVTNSYRCKLLMVFSSMQIMQIQYKL